MDKKVTITVLVENTVPPSNGLLGEHGLSYLIETGKERILFDAGQGTAAFSNFKILFPTIPRIDKIALSHGHFDHGGGLSVFMDKYPEAKVYMHPFALSKRYSNHDGRAQYIGLPEKCRKSFLFKGKKFVDSSLPMEITGGIFNTGEIPRENTFEDTGGAFFTDTKMTKHDILPDDQALWFKSSKGIVILLGCAHAGIVNTIKHICKISGLKKIHAIIGGMHLVKASPTRMRRTISTFREISPDIIAPCHCTGMDQVFELKKAFPERFKKCQCGSVFEFFKK